MTLWHLLLIILVGCCGVLVLYHHLGYPLLLSLVAKKKKPPARPLLKRSYQSNLLDSQLPPIELIIPVYNEVEVIADKIMNCALLDYPADKLTVTLICDGCTDASPAVARKTLAQPECQHLLHTLTENPINQGKIAIINTAILKSQADIIILTDASALLSVDSLLIAASYFADNTIGVVSPIYKFLTSGSVGEAHYWQYQTKIMQAETTLRGASGAHGPCYFFRRALFTPLNPGTINDDFILPMEIAAKGYRIVYDSNLITTELECANLELDQIRRRRIAAGNLQQLIHLRKLLHPRHGMLAFTFISGKALRVLMPLYLLIILFGSLILSFTYKLFLLAFVGQLIFYGLAIFQQYRAKPANKLLALIHYFVYGHLAGLMGSIGFLRGQYNKPWKRAKEQL